MRSVWLRSLMLWGGLAAFAGQAGSAAGPDFAREVRPILSNRCFKCHGPDETSREAGLRLDLRPEALRELDSGLRAVVPGHSDDSELVARIESSDADVVMPPPSTKVALTADEKRILKEWIAAGAEYKPHWAFIAPQSPPVPTVARADWPRNEIDRFVLARLEQEGLAPAAEADRATLCRRVWLDLVGVAPSPEELDAFLADTAPDAYEKLVERLMASPQYGERWARRWLDLARYADTNGYEKDRPRPIWPYRDWVIRALNTDMPFDQFTVRQLAGDLLPGATPDDIVATGFHRNTMLNEEGGIDPLEFRYLAMVDRVATTGATWLGLTTGCAQCHTHKFDPLTHTDYFALFALMNNADEPKWVIPGPEVDAQRAQATARHAALLAELPQQWPLPAGADDAAAEKTGRAARREMALLTRFDAWNREETARAVRWEVAIPAAMTSSMPHLSLLPDGSVLAGGDITKSDVYTFTLPAANHPVSAVRLEVLPHESLPAGGPGLTYYEGPEGDFFLSELEVAVAGTRRRMSRGTQSFAEGGNTAAKAIDGDMSSGWAVNGGQGREHAAVFQLESPLPAGEPLEITLRFERHFACGLGRLRFSVAENGAAEARGVSADIENMLLVEPLERSQAQRESLFTAFLLVAPELAKPVEGVRAREREMQGGQQTLVLQARPADNRRRTFRHHRGEFGQPREEVAPAAPAFLPPLSKDAPPDRLALAKWLVSPEHPLTSRVVVNRQWQAFFGRGIVPSLEDFGYQSTPPSHPELLDWLATELVRRGWSLKAIHRLIATSSTYRQASAATPELAARDRDNSLLARGPRVRLEAEVIRDTLLKSAGMLSTKMYGPGVRPPQPTGVTDGAWEASTGDDRHRRTLYTFQKRTFPFAMTTTFDGPTGESCLARRDVSNSAMQALTLLNDPMFLEVARGLATVALAAGSDDGSRLRQISRRVLSRDLDAEEAAVLLAFLGQQRQRLAAGQLDAAQLAGPGAGDATERAAWMLVARALMNLDEAIVKR